MSEKSEKIGTASSSAAIAFAVFAVVCFVAFLASRGSDIGQVPILVRNLGGGPLVGSGIFQVLAGLAVSALVLLSWVGVGTMISGLVGFSRAENHSHVLELARNAAIGAAAWSLIWFVLGIAGLYTAGASVVSIVVGCLLLVLVRRRVAEVRSESRVPQPPSMYDKALILLIALPLTLSLVAAMAPPTAKDALLYHFALPKAFVVQHSNAFVDGNIASYLALGTEMQFVWARLLGGFVVDRAAEVAESVVGWLFFPLLLAAIFGWAREMGISRRWSLVSVLVVASVPTAYHVASSGYVDIALSLFVTLAIYSLCRWWRAPSSVSAVPMAIFLGAALSIKLTSVFVLVAFALIVLFRARGAEKASKVMISGFAALLLSGVIASPWYLRTWAATGSPVFPFYMSIWPGKANGWDVERSNLFQGMNSQYGGADTDKTRYLTAPVMASVVAQPEDPANYDGVLGIAFLIGLPLVIVAWWKFDLPIEAKIAVGIAGILYLFWLFSSPQLRYLLPILPALAVGIAASAEIVGVRIASLARDAFVAASVAAMVVSFAWFCQTAPLRIVLGGETRDQYLTRNLDYYPFYQAVNTDTPPDAKVWLINMRRDTYNLERPVFSDYLFEDWTLRKLLWESRSIDELRSKANGMGISYVLTRHDFLFDYDRSTLVDDKKPRTENEAKLKIANNFILDAANAIKADGKFSFIKVF